MGRIPREPMNNPNERSSSTTWTALAVVGAILVSVAGIFIVIELVL